MRNSYNTNTLHTHHRHTHTYIQIYTYLFLHICEYVLCLVAQSCLTLCNPTDCSPPGSSAHGDSPGRNTGVGCHALLQGIFPTQGSNLHLLHGRRILYCWATRGAQYLYIQIWRRHGLCNFQSFLLLGNLSVFMVPHWKLGPSKSPPSVWPADTTPGVRFPC